MIETGATILLSVQRALLGAVPHNLRAVTCNWVGTEIKLRFVFDGEIDEENYESAGIVGTEVVADFPSPWTISEEIVRLDYPASLCAAALLLWAYRRKEDLVETGN
jgi:hypothetical protein